MSKPERYTKIPVTIEAFQFDGSEECGDRIIEWMSESGSDLMEKHYAGPGGSFSGLRGTTVDGNQYPVDAGVWILRGVEGEHYPCQDSIFRKTYRPAGRIDTTGEDTP
jgi:hypothetical protein